MSRNAIAAMAVIFVSGFAGCAATARAETETAAVETATTPAPQALVAPVAKPASAYVPQARVITTGATPGTHRAP